MFNLFLFLYTVAMDRYLAVPMGECSGVSPELILKALNAASESVGGVVVVGDARLFKKVSEDLSLSLPFSVCVTTDKELLKAQESEQFIFYDLTLIDLDKFEYGNYSSQTGEATFQCTKKAIELIHNSYCCALVTMPLDGRALKAAGHEETTYVQILDTLSIHITPHRMLDTCGVKIFTLTGQIPIKEALSELTYEKILDSLINVDAITMNQEVFDQTKPLGISTLNPHHEDSETFGKEEMEAVIPAVEAAQAIGIDVVGPIETYHLVQGAREGKYRAIVTLCYEQAIIAATSQDFYKTILVIWGCPFLVVCVDRGPLMNIAGKGIANASGALQALCLAREYVNIGVNS